MTGNTQRSGAHWLAIAMLTVTAVMLIRAAIIRDPGLRVPPIIAYVCAGVLLTGAFAVVQQLRGGPTRGHGAAVLILAGFTIMGAWIALSPSSGCTMGVNDGAGVATSGLACRIPFGIGALICALATWLVGRSWIRARRRGPTTID
jgi:hypothetical protein